MNDYAVSIPRRLGSYRIESKLSSGAMGIMFRALHVGLQRQVALKVLRPDTLRDPSSVRRFLDEARAVAQVEHSNIVSVYDAGVADGIPYIAMELLQGESLDALLTRAGSLPVDRVLTISSQLACALDHAHRRSIVHLDVKPANVMIGEGDATTLTDFGIARALSSHDATKSVAVTGTPIYMSPEQIQGEDLDCRSDIYSLGLLMYEMCAGRPLFQGSFATVIQAHISSPVPDIAEVLPNLPNALANIITRALAKDRSERFQTAGELHRALMSLKTPSFEIAADTSLALPEIEMAMAPSTRQDPGSETQPIVPPLDKQQHGPSAGEPEVSSSGRRARWATALPVGILAACAIAVTALLVPRWFSAPHANAFGTPPRSPSMTYPLGGQSYGSGHLVTLQWTRVPHAQLYRVQVAASPTAGKESDIFKQALVTDHVRGTWQTLRVVGYQIYYWRVRVEVNGRWSAYTHTKRFIVARPVIGRPVALSPRNGAFDRATSMELCWSRVRRAVAYRVTVRGLEARTVRATCTRVPVRPRTYYWSVSAYVRGAQIDRGQQSPLWKFTIGPRIEPSPTPKPTRTVQPLVQPTRSPSRVTITPPTSPSPAAPRHNTPRPTPVQHPRAPHTLPAVPAQPPTRKPTPGATAVVVPSSTPSSRPPTPSPATKTVVACDPEASVC